MNEFRQRKKLHVMIVVVFAVMVAGGWAPSDRMEWWEGNIPVVVLLVALIASYRWWPLSDVAYGLIGIFLILATLGSHYTYERNPIGVWFGKCFSIYRNPYDRMAHLAMGLLIFYPVYENLPRIEKTFAPWTYLFPACIIMAVSAVWEIAEVFYGIGMHSNPGYAGTEDQFDSQHDMAMALLGAVIGMGLTALCRLPIWHRVRRS